MESYVMVDVERLESIFGWWNCTFKKQEGDVIPSVLSEDCAYKFVIVGDQLVIGALCEHAMVYTAWTLRDEPLTGDIRECAEAISAVQYRDGNRSVTGAGKIGVDGKISGWKSECFRIGTPLARREEIAEVVGRLFSSGALRPR